MPRPSTSSPPSAELSRRALASSPSEVFWWRIANRTRVFVFGLLVGAFVIRPFLDVTSFPSVHERHEHELSKSSFLQSSQNATVSRRENRLGKTDVNVQEALQHPQPENELQEAEEHHRDDPPKQQSMRAPPLRKNPGLGLDQALEAPDTATSDDSSAKQHPKEEVVDFERQPGVVIATKIHGPGHMVQLIQSMCLLKVAYNSRPKYDILVFTSEPITNVQEATLRKVARPANVQIVLDEKTFSDHIEQMTQQQRDHLVKRCNVSSTEELFWWTRCCEEWAMGTCMPLSYTWQSEFRSLHIWKNPVLEPYRFMMWFDSDAFATQMWQQDPVAVAIRNELKIFFDNFPMGSSAGQELRDKIVQAYNETLCSLSLKEGRLHSKGGKCFKPRIANIHGFFHITDLDFYRNDENMNWFRILIGDNKFSRRWDDQLAVTVPAAMRAGDKAWDMKQNNVTLGVYHNSFLDGNKRWFWKDGRAGGGFQNWWKVYSKELFPEGVAQCHAYVKNSG